MRFCDDHQSVCLISRCPDSLTALANLKEICHSMANLRALRSPMSSLIWPLCSLLESGVPCCIANLRFAYCPNPCDPSSLSGGMIPSSYSRDYLHAIYTASHAVHCICTAFSYIDFESGCTWRAASVLDHLTTRRWRLITLIHASIFDDPGNRNLENDT